PPQCTKAHRCAHRTHTHKHKLSSDLHSALKHTGVHTEHTHINTSCPLTSTVH
ncbi:hypothetical protein LEMLEM_LOCUS20550, partial [Lemmus lemmus]